MLTFSSVFQIHKYCLGRGEGGLKHPSFVFQMQKTARALFLQNFSFANLELPIITLLQLCSFGIIYQFPFFFLSQASFFHLSFCPYPIYARLKNNKKKTCSNVWTDIPKTLLSCFRMGVKRGVTGGTGKNSQMFFFP